MVVVDDADVDEAAASVVREVDRLHAVGNVAPAQQLAPGSLPDALRAAVPRDVSGAVAVAARVLTCTTVTQHHSHATT